MRSTEPKSAAARKALRAFAKSAAGTPYVVSERAARAYPSLGARFGTYAYPALRAQHFERGVRFLQSSAAAATTKGQDVVGLALASFDSEPMKTLSPLCATQHFLTHVDLPFFLLSYLGDREEMANSVEGRVPFLDHPLVEFAAKLPASLKLRGDVEKYGLRVAASTRLPRVTKSAQKKMFLAPTLNTLGYSESGAFGDWLSAKRIKEAGVFSVRAVGMLRTMASWTRRGSVRYKHFEGALTYVLSTQLLHAMFVRDFATYAERFEKPHPSYDLGLARVARPGVERREVAAVVDSQRGEPVGA